VHCNGRLTSSSLVPEMGPGSWLKVGPTRMCEYPSPAPAQRAGQAVHEKTDTRVLMQRFWSSAPSPTAEGSAGMCWPAIEPDSWQVQSNKDVMASVVHTCQGCCACPVHALAFIPNNQSWKPGDCWLES
jgi:hypothetical protein